jgi:hypothetical protein
LSASDLVQVNVSIASSTVQQPGFGVPLILGCSATFPELVRSYSDMDGVTADFAPTTPEYKAASKMFTQSPAPSKILIGRRTHKPAMTTTVTPAAANLTVYGMTVNGTDVSYTSDGTATAQEITDGLKAAIDALAISGLTTTSTSGVLTLTSAAGGWFSCSVKSRALLSLAQTAADAGIALDLGAINLVRNDWYGFMSTHASPAEITAAFTWGAANGKLPCQLTQDTACVTSGTTDIMAVSKTGTQDAGPLIFSCNNGDFKDAAWLGKMLPKAPGSATWANKTLDGCTTDDLTQTEQDNLRSKNGNFYVSVNGAGMTLPGVTPKGSFVDNNIGKAWYASRIVTRVLTLLNTTDKVDFTDAGIASLEAEARAQNDEAIAAHFLAASPAPTVTAPKAKDVSPTDKAARRLTGLKVTATIAGAIHSTVFAINLSL